MSRFDKLTVIALGVLLGTFVAAFWVCAYIGARQIIGGLL